MGKDFQQKTHIKTTTISAEELGRSWYLQSTVPASSGHSCRQLLQFTWIIRTNYLVLIRVLFLSFTLLLGKKGSEVCFTSAEKGYDCLSQVGFFCWCKGYWCATASFCHEPGTLLSLAPCICSCSHDPSLYARDLLSASVWYSFSLWAHVLFASVLGWFCMGRWHILPLQT